jgi:Archaeal holliday junction resolvase (hjc)
MTEAELVSKLINKLKSEGFRVRTEVSNMGQSADVVATRGKWVTLIEVKVRDWSRAIAQCQAHEQIADYICIAVASVSIPDRLTQAASGAGYGILHYSRDQQEFYWIVRPRLNRQVWPPQRRYWAKSRRRILYAD